MSHYPSTAELAAFRRAIRPSWYDRTDYPADLTGLAWPMAPLDHEPNRTQRRWGIPVENGMRHIEPKARREAGAMRTRAYEASRCPVCRVPDFPDAEGCDCYGTHV